MSITDGIMENSLFGAGLGLGCSYREAQGLIPFLDQKAE
jgi:hypothetical protein